MPEGPEVKRCSEVVDEFIGRKVLSEVAPMSGKLQRLGIKNLENLRLPAKIVSVSARSKSIFIELEGEYSLVSTLGMSGWWYPPASKITKEDLDEAYYAHVVDTIEAAEKYVRLRLVTTDGSSVNYVDPRNFGNFYVLTQDEFKKRKDSFGLDFLNDARGDRWDTIEPVKRAYGKTDKPLGEVLLNQSMLSGLGNIYRAETMYLAGISPHRPASSLSENEIDRVLTCASWVLSIAYEGRGNMSYPAAVISHFHKTPFAKIVNRHLVYGCNVDIYGNPTKRETIGGRTCWWVPEMQT